MSTWQNLCIILPINNRMRPLKWQIDTTLCQSHHCQGPSIYIGHRGCGPCSTPERLSLFIVVIVQKRFLPRVGLSIISSCPLSAFFSFKIFGYFFCKLIKHEKRIMLLKIQFYWELKYSQKQILKDLFLLPWKETRYFSILQASLKSFFIFYQISSKKYKLF